MSDFAGQLLVVVSVIASFALGPGVAFVVLIWHKRRRRAMRRSPIKLNLLRSPGHTMREQLEEASNDLTFDLLTVSIMPLSFLCIYFAQERVSGPARAANLTAIYVLAAVVAIVYFVWKMTGTADALDRLRIGYDAEVEVGQTLDQLIRRGASVFHDFPADGFNIDHVVLLGSGIFAVETKGRSKNTRLAAEATYKVTYDGRQLQFPEWTSPHAIDQARLNAKWLGDWASKAIGQAVRVNAVVALPGWYVDRKGRSDVLVLAGGELDQLPRARSVQGLSNEVLNRLEYQLDQRCRTVVPTFKRQA